MTEPLTSLDIADEDNPWRTDAVRQVYSNNWIALEEHTVTRPDGKPGIYGMVHPKNLALGIVALEPDLRVWLVGQYRYTLDAYSWEIPEGGGDPALDPAVEAARELAEETGLVAGHMQHFMSLHTSNCFTSERAEIFLATDLTRGPSAPEGSEKLRIACVPLSEAVAAIDAGRITDAMSVAALLAIARR